MPLALPISLGASQATRASHTSLSLACSSSTPAPAPFTCASCRPLRSSSSSRCLARSRPPPESIVVLPAIAASTIAPARALISALLCTSSVHGPCAFCMRRWPSSTSRCLVTISPRRSGSIVVLPATAASTIASARALISARLCTSSAVAIPRKGGRGAYPYDCRRAAPCCPCPCPSPPTTPFTPGPVEGGAGWAPPMRADASKGLG
ncbi:uncharacterized protein J3D65DRAFT_614485 [Phyllosticta citribraziliensis]|uniref:Uncharacterized protein n=1 Tax=Phyllosticta citribraziliensis TaxID=989973 RepID=A0ABR1M8K4_9PEZI